MKTNRMLNIIILLLEGNELSAQELAEKFNVTEKTIYRDIDFIRESGIPIVGKRGVKGGFSIEDRDLVINKKITLKEQHKLMKLLKNQDRIPEEQLNEIMNSIENLFSDNTVDWIDAEFDEPKLNKLFFKIKEAIINQRLIELEFKKTENDMEIIKVEPYKIYISENGLFLRFYNMDKDKWDKICFNKVKDTNILKVSFVKRNYSMQVQPRVHKENGDKI